MLRFEIFCMRLVEVMFFTGLIGCSIVVVASWISIFKSGFAEADDIPRPESRSTPPAAYRFARHDF